VTGSLNSEAVAVTSGSDSRPHNGGKQKEASGHQLDIKIDINQRYSFGLFDMICRLWATDWFLVAIYLNCLFRSMVMNGWFGQTNRFFYNPLSDEAGIPLFVEILCKHLISPNVVQFNGLFTIQVCEESNPSLAGYYLTVYFAAK
jgi:hypothetical protein